MDMAERQLGALGSVVSLLDGLRIDFWLAGGWAVDFHCGEVTRSHSDIDLVVWHSDKERINQALLADGFAVTDDSDPNAEMIYQRNGLKVDLSFVTVQPDGTSVTPGWEYWPWPTGSFIKEKAQLFGVAARLISAETLLSSKSEWERNTGEAPRPQDLVDIEALRRTLQRTE
jgi:hypothetical protein